MTTEKANLSYRKYFKENRTPKYYNGILHGIFNAGLLITVIIFSLLRVEDFSLPELATVFLVIILGNLTVWGLHRYPLHVRFRFFPYPYDVHTKEHHRFFTDTHLLFDDPSDWYILFFPPQVVLGFGLLFCPISYFILNFFISPEIAFIFVASCSSYFLFYEIVHYVCHLPESHILLKNYWFSSMWKHHKIHHAPELMGQYNFNIVFPFFDYIFGTKYKGPWPLRQSRVAFTDIVHSELLQEELK